jgi:hypothetical protein
MVYIHQRYVTTLMRLLYTNDIPSFAAVVLTAQGDRPDRGTGSLKKSDIGTLRSLFWVA